MDNLDRPVYFMGSGAFRVPRRRLDPHSPGYRRDRSDRPTAAGPESSLAEKTPKRDAVLRLSTSSPPLLEPVRRLFS